MSNPESSRLSNLFKDLQQRNLIEYQRKLELSRNPLTEMQGNKLSKKILYTKNFYENVLAGLDDDTLRFVLLHEEGHIKKGSLLPYLGFFFTLLGLIFLFYYPFNFGWPYWLFYILIIIPLVYRSVFILMYREELMADAFAAEIMQKEFNIEKPSELLRRLFLKANEKTKLKGSMEKSKILMIIFAIIIGTFPGYHPADCTRIANVDEKFNKSGN